MLLPTSIHKMFYPQPVSACFNPTSPLLGRLWDLCSPTLEILVSSSTRKTPINMFLLKTRRLLSSSSVWQMGLILRADPGILPWYLFLWPFLVRWSVPPMNPVGDSALPGVGTPVWKRARNTWVVHLISRLSSPLPPLAKIPVQWLKEPPWLESHWSLQKCCGKAPKSHQQKKKKQKKTSSIGRVGQFFIAHGPRIASALKIWVPSRVATFLIERFLTWADWLIWIQTVLNLRSCYSFM